VAFGRDFGAWVWAVIPCLDAFGRKLLSSPTTFYVIAVTKGCSKRKRKCAVHSLSIAKAGVMLVQYAYLQPSFLVSHPSTSNANRI
jgi:hypothetical protein